MLANAAARSGGHCLRVRVDGDSLSGGREDVPFIVGVIRERLSEGITFLQSRKYPEEWDDVAGTCRSPT